MQDKNIKRCSHPEIPGREHPENASWCHPSSKRRRPFPLIFCCGKRTADVSAPARALSSESFPQGLAADGPILCAGKSKCTPVPSLRLFIIIVCPKAPCQCKNGEKATVFLPFLRSFCDFYAEIRKVCEGIVKKKCAGVAGAYKLLFVFRIDDIAPVKVTVFQTLN